MNTTQKLLSIFLLICISFFSARGNGRVYNDIASLKKQNSFPAEATRLFNMNLSQEEAVNALVREYLLLDASPELNKVTDNGENCLKLSIPFSRYSDSFTLLLYKVNPGDENQISTASGIDIPHQKQLHYRGIIEGDINSIVSLSFTNEEVMGFIGNENGNYVIGTLKGKKTHIIYNDKKLIPANNFQCHTPDDVLPQANVPATTTQTGTINCVRFYWEVENEIYLNKGSLPATTNYINGIFNQVQTLFYNDFVDIILQATYIWDIPDPYTGTDPATNITQFMINRPTFNGDFPVLISYDGGGGLVYIVNGICTGTTYAYAGINSTYNAIPSFSFTVNVISHEQGHMLGCHHTQWCWWVGGPIDNCNTCWNMTTDGGCPDGPAVASGTIMSYCHGCQCGINFSNGFGPQPAAFIVNAANTLPCLNPCTVCPAVVNDDCSSALLLATSDTCNPRRYSSCGATPSNTSSCSGNADDDVWFRFQAHSTTSIIYIEGDSGYDAVMEIFDGDCAALSQIQCVNTVAAGMTEFISFPSVIGKQYYIRAYNGTAAWWPGEFTICVIDSGVSTYPLLRHVLHFIDDDTITSSGNNNGLVDCGETIEMDAGIYNNGTGTAHNVLAALSTADPYITITDSIQNYPNIVPAGFASSPDFDFEVAAGCPDHYAKFFLNITSNEGAWIDSFTVRVYCNITSIENNSSGYMRAYPNPVVDVLNIESAAWVEKLVIYDVAGRTINTLINEGNPLIKVDLSMLHDGIYFVDCISSEMNYKAIIIKQ